MPLARQHALLAKPVDPARLLAVGFHRLVDRLTSANVPLLFLSFPRFIEDAEYLYTRLRSVLPSTVTRQAALRAHAALADRGKVRIGSELSNVAKVPVHSMRGPSLADLDRIALARELARQRHEGLHGRRSRSRWTRRMSDWNDRLRLRLHSLAALSSCHMLWYLHLASKVGIVGEGG